MLKVCLNGGVRRDEHPAAPITPAELAADAVRCVAAGASAVHVHPRDEDERETLDAVWVGAAITALRDACPGVQVGVTTGAWVEPDPAARIAAVRAWDVLPEFASVNVHEEGAEAVAAVLYERGVGVEAGVWTPEAALAYRRWRVPALRILVECMRPGLEEALADAEAILGALPVRRPPVLLHAEGPAVWRIAGESVRRGLSTRIGLEDTWVMPDGSPAPDNAALVRAVVALRAGRVRAS